jgi:hypothetical protein
MINVSNLLIFRLFKKNVLKVDKMKIGTYFYKDTCSGRISKPAKIPTLKFTFMDFPPCFSEQEISEGWKNGRGNVTSC